MKNFVALLSLFLVLFMVSCNNSADTLPFTPDYSVVPLPTELTPHEGYFEITGQTEIQSDSNIEGVENVVKYMNEKFNTAASFQLNTKVRSIKKPNEIIIKKSDDRTLENEGYTLEITKDNIVISVNNGAGAFYAAQTLFQLLPAEIERFALISKSDKILTFSLALFIVKLFKFTSLIKFKSAIEPELFKLKFELASPINVPVV